MPPVHGPTLFRACYYYCRVLHAMTLHCAVLIECYYPPHIAPQPNQTQWLVCMAATNTLLCVYALAAVNCCICTKPTVGLLTPQLHAPNYHLSTQPCCLKA